MTPCANLNTSSSRIDDPHVSRSPSPLSASWTPTEPVLIQNAPTSAKLRQRSESTRTRCFLCQRFDCQLRSHQIYLSAREARSKKLILQDPSYNNLANAKPNQAVDDQTIRNTFTQSYAFVGPSYLKLSVLQPSGFRLDVFHDLPISNGDRPESHGLIWNCKSDARQICCIKVVSNMFQLSVITPLLYSTYF